MARLPWTLAELARWYIAHVQLRTTKRNTVYGKRAQLAFWVEVLPKRPQKRDVSDAISAAVESGRLRRATANNYLCTLSRAYSIAADEGMPVGLNPAKHVQRFEVEEQPARGIPAHLWPTVDAVAREHGPAAWAFVRLAEFEGLRRGESLSLEPDDVDLARGEVWIRNSRNAGCVEGDGPKTKRSRRAVPIGPESREALTLALRAWRQRAADARGEAAARYVLHMGVEALDRLTKAIDEHAPGAFGELVDHPTRGRVRLGGTFHRGRHDFARGILTAPGEDGEDSGERWRRMREAMGHNHIGSTATYAARLMEGERGAGGAELVRAAHAARAARAAAAERIPRLRAVGEGSTHLVVARPGNKMGGQKTAKNTGKATI